MSQYPSGKNVWMKWKPDSESSIPPLVQYSPDMANTCCPQYTIRLDALRFDPGKNKKMRYLINRWKRYIMEGVKPGDVVLDGGKTGGKDKESKKSRYDERHLAATDQLIPNASTAISQKVRHTTISKNFIPQSTTMRLQLECNQQCGMKSRWYLRQLRAKDLRSTSAIRKPYITTDRARTICLDSTDSYVKIRSA
jgi:hypothetical protein